MKISCFLVLFATQVLDVSPAPTGLSTDVLSEDLDFSKTYLQFFKIKDLIEKINIKKFREFQELRAKGIGGQAATAEIEPEVINAAALAEPEDYLPEIDLTEEAIMNDEVSVIVPDTYVVTNAETTATPTEEAIVEEVDVTTAISVVEVRATDGGQVYVDTEVATDAPTAAPTATPTESPATTKAVKEELPSNLPEPSEEDVLLNEIDTGADKFFISKESVESAKKYGYKILLKKVNGKEVPVGKIKFTFPTLVEINAVENDDSEEVPSETVIEGVEVEESVVETESVVSKSIEKETSSPTAAALVPLVETVTEGVRVEESVVETESVVTKAIEEETVAPSTDALVPIIISEEVLSEKGVVKEEPLAETKNVTKAVEEETVAPIAAALVPVETEYIVTRGDIIEVTNTEESVTAAVEKDAETTTALAVTFLPPPLKTVIPTVESLDEYTITEGIKQITEETEVAIQEIKNQNAMDSIVFAECTAPFSDVEDMLMSLAKNIAKQTPMISEILSVGKSLKDKTSPELLSRSGARLLILLEPFLESLVPAELSGCAGESSNAMLISLSGMASQLDTIASNEINQDRATSLHKSATSLQLAAWVMAQLQSSVHTFYSQEGICGDKDSSTTEILGSLSKAITGYIPIVTMLGNQDAVDELKETIDALNKAQTDIEQLETKSGTSLPGVECGASFTEMAEGLENLADFVKALDSNVV